MAVGVVVLCGLMDLWLMVRLVRAGRTGQLEMNGSVYNRHEHRAMFITAILAHLFGLWVFSSWAAYNLWRL